MSMMNDVRPSVPSSEQLTTLTATTTSTTAVSHSVIDIDAGALPPPYMTPAPPIPPPPPAMPVTKDGLSLNLSHPISIAGSHNEINLTIPLEAALKNALTCLNKNPVSFTNNSRAQTSSSSMVSSSMLEANNGSDAIRAVQVMVHCPISIIGDCNTVTMETEVSSQPVVYVPMPMPVANNRSQMMPNQLPPQAPVRSVPINHNIPRQVPLSPPETPSSPLSPTEPRKRKAEEFFSSIDTAPFTKRPTVEETSDEHLHPDRAEASRDANRRN